MSILKPQRTVSDEFEEMLSILGQLQTQQHPYGPTSVDQAQTAFTQSCQRLRKALTGYRDSSLSSWQQLAAVSPPQTMAAVSHRVVIASRELNEMRRLVDTLHQDATACRNILLDGASDAISRNNWDESLVVERLKFAAKRLQLAQYVDVQKHEDQKTTTVTLAGTIVVVDIDIGQNYPKDPSTLNVRVSYVPDMDNDSRIGQLMLERLRAGDMRGLESLIEEIAELDRLTKEHSPANFIHNTFALVSTLAEVQRQELAALDGADPRQLMRLGTGLALPHSKHIGPSLLYHMPATALHGLSYPGGSWDDLVASDPKHPVPFTLLNQLNSEVCKWIHLGWEPTSQPKLFPPTFNNSSSQLFKGYCVADGSSPSAYATVTATHHPTIEELDLWFIELNSGKTDAMDVGDKENMPVSVPYTIVARLEPPLHACWQTLDALTGNGSSKKPLIQQQAQQENTSMLENILVVGQTSNIADTIEQPQIRACTITRIPLDHVRDLVRIAPALRRQAIFNELLASALVDPADPSLHITIKTSADDPFRINLTVNQEGLIIRVMESLHDGIMVWTHQILGIDSADDLLSQLASVTTDTLTNASAHEPLSKVANICVSISLLVDWMSSSPTKIK